MKNKFVELMKDTQATGNVIPDEVYEIYKSFQAMINNNAGCGYAVHPLTLTVISEKSTVANMLEMLFVMTEKELLDNKLLKNVLIATALRNFCLGFMMAEKYHGIKDDEKVVKTEAENEK